MAENNSHRNEDDIRSKSGTGSEGTRGCDQGRDNTSETSSILVETEINLEFKALETLSETEFNKLTVGQRKLAKNVDSIMGNLEVMKAALFTFSEGHNKLVRNVLRNSNQSRLNTDQIDIVDNELGHLVGQVADLQRVINVVQNESKGIKNELHKKDLALDTVEKEVKRKNLVISGMVEEVNENLYGRVLSILQSLRSMVRQQDIDCVYRVGTPSAGKTREVVVELFSRFVKEDILKERRKLRENELTRNIWINDDLPARTRKSHGLMRDIVRRAGELKIPCAINGDKLTCNNMSYGAEHFVALPAGIRPEDMKTRVEGKRIGYMSEESYLSNFFICPVTVDGYTFSSAEHAIQYKRSLVGKREDIGIQIKQTLRSADVKMLGEKVDYNKKWDNTKIGLIRGIVKQKFIENNTLKIKLLATAGYTLEEATFDRYWGTGVPVYSKEFRKGKHTGKNIMGRLLEEIRDEFLPKHRDEDLVPTNVVDNTTHKPQGPDVTATDQPSTIIADTQPKAPENEEQIDVTSREGNLSTTSHYLAGMSESVLKNMLLGLKNTNTGPDVQKQIIIRLGEISAMKTNT